MKIDWREYLRYGLELKIPRAILRKRFPYAVKRGFDWESDLHGISTRIKYWGKEIDVPAYKTYNIEKIIVAEFIFGGWEMNSKLHSILMKKFSDKINKDTLTAYFMDMIDLSEIPDKLNEDEMFVVKAFYPEYQGLTYNELKTVLREFIYNGLKVVVKPSSFIEFHKSIEEYFKYLREQIGG